MPSNGSDRPVQLFWDKYDGPLRGGCLASRCQRATARVRGQFQRNQEQKMEQKTTTTTLRGEKRWLSGWASRSVPFGGADNGQDKRDRLDGNAELLDDHSYKKFFNSRIATVYFEPPTRFIPVALSQPQSVTREWFCCDSTGPALDNVAIVSALNSTTAKLVPVAEYSVPNCVAHRPTTKHVNMDLRLAFSAQFGALARQVPVDLQFHSDPVRRLSNK